MLAALPLSTSILWMMLFAILAITTRASLWGWWTQFASTLSEDDVSWLLRCAPCGVYTCGVHHRLGSTPSFLGVSVTHLVALSILIRPPKYGKDLALGRQTFDTFLVPTRTSPVGVSTFGHWVFARSWPTTNPQFNCLLFIYNRQ